MNIDEILAKHRVWLSVEEAREHWGEDYSGNRKIADEYLNAVEWVANQPAPQEPHNASKNGREK